MKTIVKIIGILLIFCMIAVPFVSAGETIQGEITPELTEKQTVKPTITIEPTKPVETEIETPIPTQTLEVFQEFKELKLFSFTEDCKDFTITLKNEGTSKISFNDLKTKYGVTQPEAKKQDPNKSLTEKLIDLIDPNTFSQYEEVTLSLTLDATEKNMYFDDYWLIVKNN
jgi:hypothetical protein